MSRNKLYSILLIACFFGFGYFFYSLAQSHETFCIIKRVTGFPCPSCGNTRAIVLLTQGKIWESLVLNPLGLVVFLAMIIIPIWIGIDLIKKQNSFYLFYKKAEKFIQRKAVATILIVLIITNWYWNITKNL